MIEFIVTLSIITVAFCIGGRFYLQYRERKLFEQELHSFERLRVYLQDTIDQSNIRWYCVTEQLPEIDRWVLGYSKVFGAYYLCKFDPQAGWIGPGKSQSYKEMTYWLDQDFFMPFEFTNEIDEYLARQRGII